MKKLYGSASRKSLDLLSLLLTLNFGLCTLNSSAQVIAAGNYYSIALCPDSIVWAWGSNFRGELGDNTTIGKHTPVLVFGLTGIIGVAAGVRHSLAVKKDGTAWVWGYNAYGQLGDNTTVEKHTPVQVSGLTGITTIAGGQQHSLAVRNDGTAWAWGDNSQGQIGAGLAQTILRGLIRIRNY